MATPRADIGRFEGRLIDMDGDGDPDLVTVSHAGDFQGRVRLYRNHARFSGQYRLRSRSPLGARPTLGTAASSATVIPPNVTLVTPTY